MIKLKPRTETPAILTSERVRTFVERLRERIENGDMLQSSDFESTYWRDDNVKRSLFEMHSGKCCFCERYRDEKRETDVEHFRPKTRVTDNSTHPGYWWLAYEWDNYFHACKKCNQEHKKNQFPLMDEALRAYTPSDNLEQEKPFLINPEKENPEELIGFEWDIVYGVFVKAYGRDIEEGRGNSTISITGLNIGTLPAERASLVNFLEQIVNTMKWASRNGNERCIKDTARIIKEETKSEKQFAGFRRAFFRGNGLGNYVTND